MKTDNFGNNFHMDKINFANCLKQHRESKGYTQKQLAQSVKISERTYQFYESSANTTFPSLAKLFSIAMSLNISIDYLLGRTSNPILN